MGTKIPDAVLNEAQERLKTLWYVYHGNLVDARVLKLCLTALESYEKERQVLCDGCGLPTGPTFVVGQVDTIGPPGVFCDTCFEGAGVTRDGARYVLKNGSWRRE